MLVVRITRWVTAFRSCVEFSRENPAVVRREQTWQRRAAGQQEASAGTLVFRASLCARVRCRMFFQEHLSVM